MTVSDRVKELMADGEPRTVREIVSTLEPDRREWELSGFVQQVKNALYKGEKWGYVERVGHAKTGYGKMADIWRWSE